MGMDDLVPSSLSVVQSSKFIDFSLHSTPGWGSADDVLFQLQEVKLDAVHIVISA